MNRKMDRLSYRQELAGNLSKVMNESYRLFGEYDQSDIHYGDYIFQSLCSHGYCRTPHFSIRLNDCSSGYFNDIIEYWKISFIEGENEVPLFGAGCYVYDNMDVSRQNALCQEIIGELRELENMIKTVRSRTQESVTKDANNVFDSINMALKAK